jgi:hypothetical protein
MPDWQFSRRSLRWCAVKQRRELLVGQFDMIEQPVEIASLLPQIDLRQVGVENCDQPVEPDEPVDAGRRIDSAER